MTIIHPGPNTHDKPHGVSRAFCSVQTIAPSTTLETDLRDPSSPSRLVMRSASLNVYPGALAVLFPVAQQSEQGCVSSSISEMPSHGDISETQKQKEHREPSSWAKLPVLSTRSCTRSSSEGFCFPPRHVNPAGVGRWIVSLIPLP
nr:hypothetical protein CFP56_59652 [Quercus suber]